ncbi:hypothetical protein ES702_01064 [subsurface metagenome]
MTDNSQDQADTLQQGSEVSTPIEIKTGATIITETVKAMKELGPLYKEVGLAGFLTIAGVVIGLLTIALSFLTGTADAGRWYGGIKLEEAILFVALSITFVILGVGFLTRYNSQKTRIQQQGIEVGKERNKWIHQETMEKLRTRGSKQPNTTKEPVIDLDKG